MGWIPASGRSPGVGNGNPLQYSCLENLIDRGAWSATVHGVAKSWIRLKQQHTHTHTPESGSKGLCRQRDSNSQHCQQVRPKVGSFAIVQAVQR